LLLKKPYVDSWQSPFRKDPFEIPLETQLALLLAADAEMRRVKGVTLTETDMQFARSIRGLPQASARAFTSAK